MHSLKNNSLRACKLITWVRNQIIISALAPKSPLNITTVSVLIFLFLLFIVYHLHTIPLTSQWVTFLFTF